jgi:hypothetical protein
MSITINDFKNVIIALRNWRADNEALKPYTIPAAIASYSYEVPDYQTYEESLTSKFLSRAYNGFPNPQDFQNFEKNLSFWRFCFDNGRENVIISIIALSAWRAMNDRGLLAMCTFVDMIDNCIANNYLYGFIRPVALYIEALKNLFGKQQLDRKNFPDFNKINNEEFEELLSFIEKYVVEDYKFPLSLGATKYRKLPSNEGLPNCGVLVGNVAFYEEDTNEK